MRTVIVLLGLIYLAHAASHFEQLEWEIYRSKYGRQYQSEEEQELRRLIYNENLEKIQRHNELFDLGEVSFKMGVNQFSDMLPEEFQSAMLGLINVTEAANEIDLLYAPSGKRELPSSVDWREYGAVTGVKNQGNCGSCWAFAAAGTLESQHFLRSGVLTSLSEQNLVDCSKENHGCSGGNHWRALLYVHVNGGIDTESSYPYQGIEGPCRFDRNHIGATVRGVVGVPKSEQQLALAVAEEGPIAVAIYAGTSFQHYSSGVFIDNACDRTTNHAVLVVGYGHDSAHGDYWLVKNSWDSTWGEGGYIRMARNRNNMCRITSNAIFPIV